MYHLVDCLVLFIGWLEKKMMQVTKKSLWHPFPSLMQLIPISSPWSQPDRFLSGGLNTSLRFDGSQMFDMWQNCHIIKWLKLSSASSLTPASYIVNWKKEHMVTMLLHIFFTLCMVIYRISKCILYLLILELGGGALSLNSW